MMASQQDDTSAITATIITATAPPAPPQAPSSSSSLASPDRASALRALRHTFAPRIAKHARAIFKAARALQIVELEMHRNARLIAGKDYKNTHTVSFDIHGSIDDQLENIGEVEYGPGIKDIVAKAKEMLEDADSVAAHAQPPPLPYEEGA